MTKYKVTTAHRRFKTQRGVDRFIKRHCENTRMMLESGLIRGVEFSTVFDIVTRLFTVRIRTDRATRL